MRDVKDSDVRKAEFVDAAEKLFKENGIMDTTVNAIVKELNVAKGLFYYYFKSKDDVIDAISERYNVDFKQALIRSMDDSDDYDERLSKFVENCIVSFRCMWENLHGVNENIDLSILSTRSIDEAKEIASLALRQLLEEGKELHKLNIENPGYFADIIIGGIADLAGHTEADVLELKKIIEDLIRKSGKGE